MTTPKVPQPSAESGPPDDARTIIYVRVSTEDQAATDKVSLAEQERECRSFAAKRNREVDFIWTDPGVSGRDEERLERLTRWCEAHPRRTAPRGVIYVLNASRWGRFVYNPHASEYFRYRLHAVGWTVEAALQPSTGDRLTDGIVAVLHDAGAAAESVEKGRRALAGMLGSAAKGYWTGRPPFGFERVAVDEKTGRERLLQPFEHSAQGERVRLRPGPARDVETVRQIFAAAVRGTPLEQIARKLNRQGTPGPWHRYAGNWRSGAAPEWRLANVKSVLVNEAYLGHLCFGRRAAKDGERIRAPRADWIVVEDAWPAIVDEAVWHRANAAILARQGQRHPRRVVYLLTGLAVCTRCGGRLVGGGGSRPTASNPARYAFYRCAHRCEPGVYVSRALLEGEVVKLTEQHVRELVRGRAFDKAVDEALAVQRRATEGRPVEQDRERALLYARQQRDRLIAAIADGTLLKAEAAAQLDSVRREMEALEAEEHQDRFATRRYTLTPKERKALREMAAHFSERLAKADPATARQLLAYWIAEVAIDSKRRVGRLVLRKAPLQSLAIDSSAGRSSGYCGRRRRRPRAPAWRAPGP